MRISDWSSDVWSSDLGHDIVGADIADRLMDHGADARVGADRERADRTAARDEAVDRLLNLALGRIGGVVHRLGVSLDPVGTLLLTDGRGFAFVTQHTLNCSRPRPRHGGASGAWEA